MEEKVAFLMELVQDLDKANAPAGKALAAFKNGSVHEAGLR